MRGLVYEQGGVRLAADLDDPVPEPGEVRIRVILAGICATDLEIARGYMGFEGVLGHEFVGRVEEPSCPRWDGVRVVGGINCACGVCAHCRRGQDRHCPNRTVLGILSRPGAFAEYLVLPERNLVRVPDSVPDTDAVFAEPLAAVLRVGEQVEVTAADRVAVLGDGRLGLLAAGMGISRGWRVFLVGKHPEKMGRLSGLAGTFQPGQGPADSFDVVLECTGAPEGFPEALRLLRPEGRLVLKTTVAEPGVVDWNDVVINEITVIGSRCGSMKSAVDFLTEGLFSPAQLITERYPLSRGAEAFRAAADPRNIKVILEMGSGD